MSAPTTSIDDRDERTHAPVGTFETVDGAARAVSHLAELEYDPASVTIAPRDFVEIGRPRLRDRVAPSAARGAVVAAALVASVTIVVALGTTMLTIVLPLAVAAAAVGGAVGVVRAVRDHRRAVRWLAPGTRGLQPSAFDVVVDHEATSARHDLATWWDPTAPPVQRTAGARG